MKKSEKKKLTIYPNPRALEVVGDTTTECNLGIEAFADLMLRAEKNLSFSRSEWCFFADIANCTMWDVSIPINDQLEMSVIDSIALDRTNEKWFQKPSETDAFVEKVKALTVLEGWVVVWACRFFWDNHATLDHNKDEWWTIAFRRDFNKKEGKK